MAEGISWLHLTDLHWGSKGFSERWGSVRSRMMSDVGGLIAKLDGELDLVLFTGDLTQSATPEQFAGLENFLAELWRLFEKHGCSPKLVAVPGNHDLQWPAPVARNSLAYNALMGSWLQDHIQNTFWDVSAASETRDLVFKTFANYADWWRTTACPRLTGNAGVLPGDLSATFDKGGIKLGIVGLNSAFLQLKEGLQEQDGPLDIRLAQLHAACGGDADRWIDSHDVCLLLTHHPHTWMREGGKPFVAEICEGPSRFALHLFGHMHEQRLAEISQQGGQPRRILQGASLFSVEPWGAQRKLRLVAGYSAGRLVAKGTGYAYTLFPRRDIRLGDDSSRIEKDPAFAYASAADESTRWTEIRAKPGSRNATRDPVVSGFAEMFTRVAAFCGPPDYSDVHQTLSELIRKHGATFGRLEVKNIAFDMQHTLPFLEGILKRSWPDGMVWRTILIDHKNGKCRKAFSTNRNIKLKTAEDSEQRLADILEHESAALEAKRIDLDARAYGEVPIFHGFLVNQSILIAGICMVRKAGFTTTPYMVFLQDRDNADVDASIAERSIEMFSGWFDEQWAAGRAIRKPSPPPVPRALG